MMIIDVVAEAQVQFIDPQVNATTKVARNITSNQQMATLVGVQAFFWVPVILFIVTGCTVCFMMKMDADKHKDTLVYAKFNANMKDK